MIKYFCDHCGKELTSREICELDSSNTFYDLRIGKSLWYDAHLCPECYQKRLYAHCDLDNESLGRMK